MDTTAEVLLIIVSAVLAIFLVILSIAGILFVRILNHVKKVTERAASVADSVESAANAFEKAAGPMAIIKLIGNVIKTAQKAKSGRKKV